jgi:hypothetical protein
VQRQQVSAPTNFSTNRFQHQQISEPTDFRAYEVIRDQGGTALANLDASDQEAKRCREIVLST